MDKIVFVYADDWEGVYLDGNLLQQRHSIDAYELIQDLVRVGVTLGSTTSIDSIEARDWIMHEGYLPNTYKEFEEKQIEN